MSRYRIAILRQFSSLVTCEFAGISYKGTVADDLNTSGMVRRRCVHFLLVCVCVSVQGVCVCESVQKCVIVCLCSQGCVCERSKVCVRVFEGLCEQRDHKEREERDQSPDAKQ